MLATFPWQGANDQRPLDAEIRTITLPIHIMARAVINLDYFIVGSAERDITRPAGFGVGVGF